MARHRLVVGSAKAPTGHSNRTPLMPIRFIEEVVYNPYWNVPGRIEDEINVGLRSDPAAWYRSRGYERVDTGLASERWRQRPGPNNVLGRVKFQFKNPHNVYLHDTQEKYYFRFLLRAYSHGCMRVQDPLDLAAYLLTVDGQYDPAWVDEVLNHRRPYRQEVVSLQRPVPLHVVYWNARVDADDGVMFLRDIYAIDARPVRARMQALGF
jgi:murein L,D-transpeptidase YcbB/YkuD